MQSQHFGVKSIAACPFFISSHAGTTQAFSDQTDTFGESRQFNVRRWSVGVFSFTPWLFYSRRPEGEVSRAVRGSSDPLGKQGLKYGWEH